MDIYVGKAEVKSTDVFQHKWLYVELHDWLIEFNYAQPSDPAFPEKFFWETRQQDGTKEFWIWWRPVKVIEGNQFWRRVINIDFHGVRMRQVDIMYKGKKIKADKGKFELLLQAKLEIDVGGVWASSILRPIWELFWKRIFRKEIDQYRKEVMADMKTIQDIGRRFYHLGALAAEKVPFVPAKGYEEREF
jgi:hypothetical protein